MEFEVVLFAMIATIPASDIFLPSLPQMSHDFLVSEAAIKSTIVIFQMGCIISALFMGFLSDQFGRKPLLMTGLILFCTGSLVCTFSSHYGLFLLGRFLQGCGAITIPVVGWALIYDKYDEQKSAYIMAIMGGFFSLSPLISPTLGGYIAVKLGWHWNFSILALLSFLALAFTSKLREEPRQRERASLSLSHYYQSFQTVFDNKIFLLYVLIFALLISSEWFYLTHVPFYLEKFIGLNPQQSGFFISFVGLFYLLGAMVTPYFIRTFGIKETAGIGLKIACLSTVFTLASLVVDKGILIFFAIGISIFLFGQALTWSPSTTISLQSVKTQKGVASSVRSLLFVGAGALGSYLSSLTENHSALPISISLSVCSLASLFLFMKNKHH